MNGKSWFFVLLTQICSNGFWILREDGWELSPIMLIPCVAGAGVVLFILDEIITALEG